MAAKNDITYMRMALRLAEREPGLVAPNPAVGAVIVKEDKVIGKGRHRRFGGPHAEINAIEDCIKQGLNCRGATMYVTLEPCCHHGKTGPCTDAIIEAGLAKVVVAAIDPSAKVNGKGLERLRQAGIAADVGICENEAKFLNAPFMKFAKTGRCWVTVKWAQTIDGKLAWARQTAQQRWISSQQSRKDAHKLRRRAGAILVGVNTVLADDPLLTPRPARGKKPVRVVLDSRLRVPIDCQLLSTIRKGPVIIYADGGAVNLHKRKARQITDKGAEIITYTGKEEHNLGFLLDELARRDVQHLLVEGGPTVIGSFLKAGLADEVVVYIAPKILARQGSADISRSMNRLTQNVDLHNVDTKRFGGDIRITGLTQKGMDVIFVPLD